MRRLAIIAAVMSLGAPALAEKAETDARHDGANATIGPEYHLQCGANAGCTNR